MALILTKIETMHPDWYFSFFDQIFKRTTYRQEVDLVNSLYPISNSDVLEIGAGKGYHSAEIILHKPKRLGLVDIEPESIEILMNKFSDYQNVEFYQSDAFILRLQYPYSISLVYYSILQQVASLDTFKSRIKYILDNLVVSDGLLGFEYIDYEVSINIYPDGVANSVIERPDIKVNVKSMYSEESIKIQYYGQIKKRDIYYSVDLIKLDSSILENLFLELNVIEVERLNLDDTKRRKMSFIKKRASHQQNVSAMVP